MPNDRHRRVILEGEKLGHTVIISITHSGVWIVFCFAKNGVRTKADFDFQHIKN